MSWSCELQNLGVLPEHLVAVVQQQVLGHGTAAPQRGLEALPQPKERRGTVKKQIGRREKTTVTQQKLISWLIGYNVYATHD